MGLELSILLGGQGGGDLALPLHVEVYERLGETTWFSIRYPEDVDEGDFLRLREASLDPDATVTLSVPVNNGLECLVKGSIYSQHIHLQHGGEGSWVEVRGADTSLVMDRENKAAVWNDVTDSETVMSILGNYSLTPDVLNTSARHLETKHSLVQRSTDLRFIRRLARRNGCYFWISCDAFGLETGHFQRPQLDRIPDVNLVINQESPNVQYLDIEWDAERPTSVTGAQLDLSGKNDLDGGLPQTPQTSLGSRNRQAISGIVRSVHVAAPVDDAGDMQARSEGALIEADWFIRASCRTSLHRLGQLVRAHSIATVSGAGSRHSGNYLVAGVRHIIDPAAHVMEIELLRNGWE